LWKHAGLAEIVEPAARRISTAMSARLMSPSDSGR
jgi:hypothetical protein